MIKVNKFSFFFRLNEIENMFSVFLSSSIQRPPSEQMEAIYSEVTVVAGLLSGLVARYGEVT